MTAETTFDFTRLTEREKYKILIGAVVPRPIALVTTVDTEGRVNAAPVSFFNCLSAEPAILALGVENHDDMSFKDTAWNVRATGVFTVNIVSSAMLDAMNVCAVPFAPNVDELAEAGLTAIAGTKIAAPRIAESPAAFECRRHMTLGLGNSREIILGEVVAAHIRSDIINQRLHIDPMGLDAIGRMGGHGYSLSRETFDLPTMSVAQWEQRKRMPGAAE
ncbi:MAG: flavin reductase family protein [Mesorhizobium sp.]|uniref:flavin reductase family protein n=1 Tax=unclassified Mesorhizobium TaxID=325217 RepID=UPI00109C4C68|nr:MULTISPECIES: flavin reductase family protein [unclassified Mesorhizobium]TGQ77067.1 flavin reductase family protein [Mesorhizobium sp. M8A.F.Ca.ET.207.01.1.1]TIT34543.1 MAG: flavin reductase family protein [Mesorhizobium sp.]